MIERTEVEVDSLRISLTNQHRLLLLKEKEGPLSLPIFIGQHEAESLMLALQNIEISRPLALDLTRSVIRTLNARLSFIEITELKAPSLYAELVLANENGEEVRIDARPSDAISIALRAHVPMFVRRDLMLATGIQPENDIRRKSTPREMPDTPGDDDLSAFEDFFNNLNGSPEI